jgi:HAD superfamily hydrolase (TIGR01509 family)
MAGVQALLFDAGNTLVSLDYRFLIELIAGVRTPPPLELLRAADQHVRFRLDAALQERARRNGGLPSGAASMGSPELWKRYLGGLFEAMGVPQQHRDGFVAAAYRKDKRDAAGLWCGLEEGLPGVLQELRRRGYILAVVSNSDGRLRLKFDTLNLTSYFAFILDSAEVGVEKPDRRLFEMAASMCGVAPAQCAYIGDLLAVDIFGARSAGMQGVLFDPAGLYSAIEPERVRSCRDLLERFN